MNSASQNEGEVLDEFDFDIAGLATGPLGGPFSALTTFCFSGIFERVPDLQVVLVEARVGGVSYVLEQMDDRYWRNRSWANVSLGRLPSEYFCRNMAATFILDKFAVANRHAVGVDQFAVVVPLSAPRQDKVAATPAGGAHKRYLGRTGLRAGRLCSPRCEGVMANSTAPHLD
jgi:hypothetical protein